MVARGAAASTCGGCEHLTVRAEATRTFPGPRRGQLPVEPGLPEAEPALRLSCSHPESVSEASRYGVPLAQELQVEHLDGADQAVGSRDLALLAFHPAAVLLSEVPEPPRPVWCRGGQASGAPDSPAL